MNQPDAGSDLAFFAHTLKKHLLSEQSDKIAPDLRTFHPFEKALNFTGKFLDAGPFSFYIDPLGFHRLRIVIRGKLYKWAPLGALWSLDDESSEF